MTITYRTIPQRKLHVSEPAAFMFGNPSNTPEDPTWSEESENWLKSRYHFSFAEYYNPSNSSFGALRVMNDDLVQPKRGFGAHPHRNMEIITYVVNGNLTHVDDMGNAESLGRGSIQFMTAGSGVVHSEFNNGDKPLRFIQTWIVPRQRGLDPNYGSYDSRASKENCVSYKNVVQHLASDVTRNVDTPAKINQDVNTHAAELELGKTVTVRLPKGRQAYLLAVEGVIHVNGTTLKKHDGMEIQTSPASSSSGDEDEILEITATGVEATETGDVAHFLMFDMAQVPGSGRMDL